MKYTPEVMATFVEQYIEHRTNKVVKIDRRFNFRGIILLEQAFVHAMGWFQTNQVFKHQ